MADRRKKNIDWEGVEKEYRAGQLSNVVIANRYHTSEASIRRVAKRDGWTKDLAKQVREKVREKLVREEVKKPDEKCNEKTCQNKKQRKDSRELTVKPETPPLETDEEIVDRAAERGAEVVRNHRKDISKQRDIAFSLLTALEADNGRTVVTKAGKKITVKSSLKEKSEILRNIAQAAHKYIPLERQAFNLDESAGSDGLANAVMPIVVAVVQKMTIKQTDEKQ